MGAEAPRPRERLSDLLMLSMVQLAQTVVCTDSECPYFLGIVYLKCSGRGTCAAKGQCCPHTADVAQEGHSSQLAPRAAAGGSQRHQEQGRPLARHVPSGVAPYAPSPCSGSTVPPGSGTFLRGPSVGVSCAAVPGHEGLETEPLGPQFWVNV